VNDWKIRQEIYHRLNTEFDDDLKTKDVQISDDVVNNAIRYFTDRNIGWIYPAKSYMVGICYARWLSEYFGGNPIEYLNEEDLLFGNDPYFKTYSSDKDIYDQILYTINHWKFDETTGLVPDVKKYFLEEFML
jgi:hypothetical protein